MLKLLEGRMVRFALAFAICCSASPAAHAQSMADAESFVRGVYNQFYTGSEGGEPSNSDDMKNAVSTPSLAAMFKEDAALSERDEEEGGLNADPFCSCQDPDGMRVVYVKALSTGSGRATVDVRIKFDTETKKLRFSLVTINGAWRINDIFERGNSVRKALSEDIAYRRKHVQPRR